MAGPLVEPFARWQQHLVRQQAAAEDASHCAPRGAREASHNTIATNVAAPRCVQR
jgi:hypothetical protein